MIHPDTLRFLAELKEHNHKEWFDQHRDRYQAARENFIDTLDQLLERLVPHDPDLLGVEARASLFRINRDVRFSKNKAPYKTNLAGYLAKGGRKSNLSGYYVQLAPGSVFVGGGQYMPASPDLKKIRARLDFEAAGLRKITSDKTFLDTFGPLEGERLKTAPQGYPKDHPDIDLLNLKQFFVSYTFTDQEALKPDFPDKMAEVFLLMMPINHWLNEAIENE
jgi:uncharacterized protein (TIGR02453 family)